MKFRIQHLEQNFTRNPISSYLVANVDHVTLRGPTLIFMGSLTCTFRLFGWKKFSDILQILGSIWVPWQGIPAIIKTLNPWVKYIYIGGRLKFLKGRPDRTNKIYFRLIFILLTIWHRVRYKIFGTELFINGTESFINGTESFINGTEFFMNGTESFTNGTEYFRNGTELFINSSFFKMAPKLYTVITDMSILNLWWMKNRL